jgi:hypothetical protein
LNNKFLSTKKTISLFLAFILVTGTIALSSPSSMRDVQAQQGYDGIDNNYENDYGKDNSYKSKDNKIVKKVKCNNINVNLNGLELSGLPPSLGGLLNGGEGDVNSYGSYDGSEVQQSGYDNNNNNFKFVCINNNNNTVIGGEEPEPSELCEECFGANITLQGAIVNFLVNNANNNNTIIFTDVEGRVLEIGPDVVTIEQLCALIEGVSIPLTDVFLDFTIRALVGLFGTTDPQEGIAALIECLLEAGVIVEATT